MKNWTQFEVDDNKTFRTDDPNNKLSHEEMVQLNATRSKIKQEERHKRTFKTTQPPVPVAPPVKEENDKGSGKLTKAIYAINALSTAGADLSLDHLLGEEKQARLNAQMNSLSSELHEIVLPT